MIGNKKVNSRIVRVVVSIIIVATIIVSGSYKVFATNDNLGPISSKDVIYQIITDRFYDGDTLNNTPKGFDSKLYDGTGSDLKLYQGGDWKGIIDKIPYLKNMGITAVWISAPYENRDTEIIDYQKDGSVNKWTSFHGYHVRNYFATNKHFGTLNEFKELRDALHENGIKLIIDFVTNHTSRYKNPTDNFSNEDGKLFEPDRLDNGNYALDDFGEPYDYNGDGLIENLVADPNNDVNGWFHNYGDRGNDNSKWAFRNKDLGSLADFSQENENVVAYLEKATKYWAEMGIDGLRHDATLHMNPSFVKGLKDSIDNINTITHFGEFFISRPDPKYGEYVDFPKYTGVNNLDFEMFRALSSTFGSFSTDMKDFGNMLTYTQNDYEYENQAVTFMDNHDVTRFGYIQPNKKVYNACLAALLTSRGIPNIYYGTEQYVVPADASDIAGRVFMQKEYGFDESTTAYSLINKLSKLRKDNNALAFGETSIRYSDNDVIVFERKFYDDVILVAINRQPDKEFNISNVYTSLADGEYTDYLNGLLFGEGVNVSGNKINNISLAGGEVSIWEQKSKEFNTPRIGDIVSTVGRVGGKVHIYGGNLQDVNKVKFGDVESVILSKNANEIVTKVPEGTKTGRIGVSVYSNFGSSNEITYNVLTDDQNQIVFHVNAETNYGETIHLVGNVPELGNWDVNNSTEAFLNPQYPNWYLPVSVPKSTNIEFKFIKKDSSGNVVWESNINNRSIKSSDNPEGVIDSPLYYWDR